MSPVKRLKSDSGGNSAVAHHTMERPASMPFDINDHLLNTSLVGQMLHQQSVLNDAALRGNMSAPTARIAQLVVRTTVHIFRLTERSVMFKNLWSFNGAS